ncbi:MAG: hypothetical protein HKO65_20255 [Gemmatimonadetes bacterium]|nr:hypothetical protein [Gemmatimonadota bacterium]
MTSEPPVYSYHSSTGVAPESAGEDAGQKDGAGSGTKASKAASTVNRILDVLTWAVLFVVLLVWAVVGAVFWIPLMIRAMIRFCISLIEAMFEGHKPATAARILRDAVSFYRRGFVVAIEVVTGEQVNPKEEGPVTENRLLFEVLWALLVWYFLALLFGWIQASPLDLVDWFFSIPWAEYFRDLVSRFRT